LLDNLISILTIPNLAKRYFRSQREDVRKIKRIKADFYEQMWKDAAAQTGSTIEALGYGIFKITKNGKSLLVQQQYTQWGDAVTDRLIANKKIIYDLLSKIDAPLPRYLHLKSPDVSSARSFMRAIDGPLVVKPTYGTGAGEGITTNVIGSRQLYRALAWSRTFCPETLLEEQIKGNNYRLLFLDGELLDCIIRHPPTVTGDGESSIRRLICRENAARVNNGSPLAQDLIHLDLDTKYTLAAQGLSLSTRPSKGQVVKVKDIINANRAKENESPPERPAESLMELGRKISATIGVRLAGIDIIAEDLTSDLRDSGGAVIEVNTPPGHFYHHLKKGKGYPVAVRLLEAAFTDGAPEARAFQR
jgi:glutathione synthase/RimK-type ligase-like ATP-grasp enzyme